MMIASLQSAPSPPPAAPDHYKALAALAQQLVTVTSKMEILTTEVWGLRKTVSEQAAAARAQAQAAASRGASSGNNNNNNNNNDNDSNNNAQADPNGGLSQTRNEVNQLLAKELFEQAFTKAVAITTPRWPPTAARDPTSRRS